MPADLDVELTRLAQMTCSVDHPERKLKDALINLGTAGCHGDPLAVASPSGP